MLCVPWAITGVLLAGRLEYVADKYVSTTINDKSEYNKQLVHFTYRLFNDDINKQRGLGRIGNEHTG